jgi:hypothetical protein
VLLTFVNVCLLISGSDSSLNSTWWMLRFLITSCVCGGFGGRGDRGGKGWGCLREGRLNSGHNGQAGGTLTTSTCQHNRASTCGTSSPEFITTHLYVCVFIAWCRTQPEEPEAGALIAQHAHSLRCGGITDSSATTAPAAAVVASDAAGAQAPMTLRGGVIQRRQRSTRTGAGADNHAADTYCHRQLPQPPGYHGVDDAGISYSWEYRNWLTKRPHLWHSSTTRQATSCAGHIPVFRS